MRDTWGDAVGGLRVVSLTPGPTSSRLEEELAEVQGYRLRWEFRLPDRDRTEKVMITNQLSSGDLRGYAFEAETSEFVRMYPLEGEGLLRFILQDIAADYAGWVFVVGSVEVEPMAEGDGEQIAGLVPGVFEELCGVV